MTGTVDGIEGVGHGLEQPQRLIGGHGAVVQPIRQAALTRQAHHEVAPPVRLAGVEHRDDVGVIERREGVAFPFEPQAERRVGPHRPAHQFHRGAAAEGGVARAVHRRLPPVADLPLELPRPEEQPRRGGAHLRAGSTSRAVDCVHARAAT